MQEHLRERRRQVADELATALHAGNAVTGIDEVWQLAREGRGRLVVLEEDYRSQPRREVDGRLVAADAARSAWRRHEPTRSFLKSMLEIQGAWRSALRSQILTRARR